MSISDRVENRDGPHPHKYNYIEWLMSFTIDDLEMPPGSYKKLLLRLWDIPFESSLGNDSDRGLDGLELRTRYDYMFARMFDMDGFIDTSYIFGPCRVLEMLIGISMRMYDFMLDTEEYNSVGRWFWEIINNLGLDYLDDDHYDLYKGDAVIFAIVGQVLKRENPNNQRGGWFYSKNWDQTEIWQQMNEYLSKYF